MQNIIFNKQKTVLFRFIIALSLIILFTLVIKIYKNNVLIANAETQRDLHYTSVTIEDNDTLWNLAAEYYSDEFNSIEELVKEIKLLNNLGSDKINYGNNILIPYYE